jgi:hypothetical protein
MGRWLLLHLLPRIGPIFPERRRFADLTGMSAKTTISLTINHPGFKRCANSLPGLNYAPFALTVRAFIESR